MMESSSEYISPLTSVPPIAVTARHIVSLKSKVRERERNALPAGVRDFSRAVSAYT